MNTNKFFSAPEHKLQHAQNAVNMIKFEVNDSL